MVTTAPTPTPTTTTTTTTTIVEPIVHLKIYNPRRQSFGAALDQVIDCIVQQINVNLVPHVWAVAQNSNQAQTTNQTTASSTSGATQPTVLNNSGGQITQYLIYGLSGGRIAPAASGASAIEPIFQALASAAVGLTLPVMIVGPSSVVLANPGEAITAGAWGWLSASVPGKVTSIMPTSGRRYRVCQFASAIVNGSGAVAAYLFLFPQGAATL